MDEKIMAPKYKFIKVPISAVKIINAGNVVDLETRTNDWLKKQSEFTIVSTSITTLEHIANSNSQVLNMVITYTYLIDKQVPVVELELELIREEQQ